MWLVPPEEEEKEELSIEIIIPTRYVRLCMKTKERHQVSKLTRRHRTAPRELYIYIYQQFTETHQPGERNNRT